MDNFIFRNPTKIIFGKNTEETVGSEVLNYSKNILFVYGGQSIKRTGLYDKVISSLNKNGISVAELPGVKPNPRLSLVREGIMLCREKGIDFILAVGGGSAIDTAKAIAMGAVYEGDVWDFFTGKAEPEKELPVGTILTIPAAGSEASNGCVITNEDGWYKRAADFSLNYPAFSILNPELAYTLPKYQMASGGADILAHLMERYFTNSKDVELIDRLIESTMKTVIKYLPGMIDNTGGYQAFAEVMWSGTIAHNNLLNTGRVGDWASHCIEHEVSGIYDVAHGAGLAVVFPAWMKYVYKHDVNRFVQFAVRVFNVENSFWDPERTALEGIRRLEDFMHSIGLTTSLKELISEDNRLKEMAEKGTDFDTKTIGNFVKLTSKDIYEILKIAY
jgi:alcohol dehydrogenase